jgi:hypothetical protein
MNISEVDDRNDDDIDINSIHSLFIYVLAQLAK